MPRLMLTASTRPLSFGSSLPDRLRPTFSQFEADGWLLREACPRYFLCWRNSALVLESTVPVAIFPDGQATLSVEERALFLLFELFRRLLRIETIKAGRQASAIDEPGTSRLLAGRAAALLWGDAVDPAAALRLLRQAELRIVKAVAGLWADDGQSGPAFLPPHLREVRPPRDAWQQRG
ncbi:hypothetical protein [Tistlia consotensis]|uniref:hypothetical protein n=1 Tax=Tistlia consotensis TaxID=1321365 RepID=UPI00117FE61C|nr:hypothetical protein [Tistlia consotensis]